MNVNSFKSQLVIKTWCSPGFKFGKLQIYSDQIQARHIDKTVQYRRKNVFQNTNNNHNHCD